ncbi:unnamed protein product, partial [Hapterophycus canaliculatus]
MQMKSVASLLLKDVPGHRVRDSSFWTLAYRQLVHARPENGPQHLYERLLPYLNTRPLLSNVPAALSKDAVIAFRTPPRGGNPSKARIIWEATRHCLQLM